MFHDSFAGRCAAPVVAFLLVLVPAASAKTRTTSLAQAVPETALFYGSVDVGRVLAEFDTLDLLRLYRDSEVQEFLAPMIEHVKNSTRRESAALRMLNIYGLPQIIGGRVELAILGAGFPQSNGETIWRDVTNAPGPAGIQELTRGSGKGPRVVIPELVLSIETSGREAFESALERAIELIPTQTQRLQSQRDGLVYEVLTVEIPDAGGWQMPIYHGFVDDRFVLALCEDRLLRVADGLRSGGSEASLASHETFQLWQESAVRGSEIVELFGNVDHIMTAALPWSDSPRELDDLHRTGLDDVQGAGYAIALESGRLRDSVVLVLPEKRRGALGFLDALRPGCVVAEGVPADAAAAAAWCLDSEVLFDRVASFVESIGSREYEEMERELAQAREELGFDIRTDLLASLGSRVTFYSSLPRSGFIPEVAGAIELKDRQQLVAVIDEIKKRVVRETDGQVSFRDLPISGHEGAFWLKIKGAPVAPAFCLDEDTLHFALSANTLKRRLAASAGTGIAEDSADFAECVATTVGQSFDQVAGMLYVDVARGAEYGLGMSQMFLPQILSEAPVELDASLMPFPEKIASYLSGLLLTLRVSDRAVAIDMSSPVGGLMLPMLASWLVFQQRVVVAEYSTREAALRQLELEAGPVAQPSPDSPFIGFNFEPSDVTGNGIPIQSIITGTPAASAGLDAGDLIVGINDFKIGIWDDLGQALEGKVPGDEVVVEVLREDEVFTFPLKLGRRGDHVEQP